MALKKKRGKKSRGCGPGRIGIKGYRVGPYCRKRPRRKRR